MVSVASLLSVVPAFETLQRYFRASEAAYYTPIGITPMYKSYENGNYCRKKVKSIKIEPS